MKKNYRMEQDPEHVARYRRIVTFHDNRNTERIIEKLKEYKLSLITEAVTKGLNPDVEMKDSGIAFIGQIPNQWYQAKLGVGLLLIQTGPFGSQLHADDYVEKGYAYLVNPANIKDGKINLDEKCTLSEETINKLPQHIMKVGTIVFARRGEMGRCACIEDHNNIYFCGTGSIQLRCNELLDYQYVKYYLQTTYIKQYLELKSVGTTMPNLNSSIIANIPALFPPIEEQRQIVQTIERLTCSIDEQIRLKNELLMRLCEYKKSLIYEVVTGKKEV